MMRHAFYGGPLDTVVFLADNATLAEVEEIEWESYKADPDPEPMMDGINLLKWHYRFDLDQAEGIAPSLDVNEHRPSTPVEEVEESAAVEPTPESLKTRRSQMRLSRQQLADKSGLSNGAIWRIETKGGKPDEVAAYVRALNDGQ